MQLIMPFANYWTKYDSVAQVSSTLKQKARLMKQGLSQYYNCLYLHPELLSENRLRYMQLNLNVSTCSSRKVPSQQRF
jgi:hypothetical protein